MEKKVDELKKVQKKLTESMESQNALEEEQEKKNETIRELEVNYMQADIHNVHTYTHTYIHCTYIVHTLHIQTYIVHLSIISAVMVIWYAQG